MTVRVGDLGTADTELRPHGFVCVGSQRRDARVRHGSVPAGTPVVVVGGDTLGLIVVPAADAPAPLPRHGEPVPGTFTDCLAADAERAAADRSADLIAYRRRNSKLTAGVGAVGAAVTAGRAWPDLPDWLGEPLVPAGLLVVAGGLLGPGLFRLLDDALGRSDDGLRRAAPASVCLGLVGAFGAAAAVAPVLSLPATLAAAVVAGVLLALAPLGLMAFAGGAG